MEYLKEIGQFLWAVINNWAGYCTGGVIVALLWLFSTVKEVSIPRKIGIGVALFFLFCAFFNAWRDQLHEKQKLESNLAGNRPRLRGEIYQVAIGESSDHTQTIVVLWVTIYNSGLPSIAEKYHLSFSTSDGVIKGQQSMLPPKGVVFAGSGSQIDDADKYSLVDATATNPVVSGASKAGLLMFTFPPNNREILNQNLKGIKLTFVDIDGNTYQAQSTLDRITQQPSYYPGGPKVSPETTPK
ncbi:MAG TPA: hypothetical protein VNY74_09420 [Edaphobacter sp.]|jgi:hypothetical protein|nr:hypothetical protein [Edaphobacter sp.]